MFSSLFFLSSVLAFSGRLTYFDPGLGACGQTHSGSDYIVAMNSGQYSGTCGRSLCVSYGGRSATVRVVDLCPGCPQNALDASPSVFRHLVGSLGPGVVTVNWVWGGCESNSGSNDESTSRRRSSSTTTTSSARATTSSSSSSSSRSSSSSSSSSTENSSARTASFIPLSQRTACYISN